MNLGPAKPLVCSSCHTPTRKQREARKEAIRIKPRVYDIPEHYRMKELPLNNGLVALIDDADYPALSAHKWYVNPDGYVIRTAPHQTNPGRKTTIYMHRAIMGCTLGDGVRVDHRDVNTLNCQRGNLRIATHMQNMQNKPAYRNNASGFKCSGKIDLKIGAVPA